MRRAIAPLYDPLQKFNGATITDAVSLANTVADFTKTSIVELINNVIIDCEASRKTSVPLEALRVLAHKVAAMPPVLADKGHGS